MVKLYITFIRPHLEYACTVWSPYLQKDIQALENVQKIYFQSVHWPVVNGLWNTAKLSKYIVSSNKEMQAEIEFTL